MAADCLLALRVNDEEDPDGTYVGAVLVAEFIHAVRSALSKK